MSADDDADDAGAGTFASLRPRLIRVAYRMLGSVAEAEDVVQDAYLRWHAVDRAAVRDPRAFLGQTVTRLCLDRLKSARVQRETYPGEWLPEPVIAADEGDAADDLTLTLMLALGRLSPLERATFLLHDVFGLGFDEVAGAIARDPAACRQLAARARDHVRAARPRYPVSEAHGKHLADAFLDATRSGDVARLQALLAADVVFVADGGGKRPAALAPILGAAQVAEFFAALGSRGVLPPAHQFAVIDGLPGFVMFAGDEVVQTIALAVDDGRISAVYVVRNPDKLQRLAGLTRAP
jgi:RNA polymerase sigma-70 factor (ECF subfamily)